MKTQKYRLDNSVKVSAGSLHSKVPILNDGLPSGFSPVQGCRNCSILPSRMGEHEVSLENGGQHGEHGEHGKDGRHQPDDSKATRRLLKEKSKLSLVDV